MGLIISGVAACETIDSSGEILKIDGLDISSLERDGVFNWEHESKTASSIVGKILKAKKIFSDQDCVNDSQKKYWKALQSPFVWVMGELFDDVGHSEAMNIAAMIRYDLKAKAEGKYTEDMAQLINLSVEGAKLKKEGNMVLRSIARKVSITITPCNKVAQAEAHQSDVAKSGSNKKGGKLPGDLSIFKAEEMPEAEIYESLEKAGHLTLVKPAQPVGTTKSGKSIGQPHQRLDYHKDFSPQDHKDAHEAHMAAASAAKDHKTAAAHRTAANFHHQSSLPKRAATPKSASTVKAVGPATKVTPQKHTPYGQIGGMKKAMTLGSAGGAPSTLTGGAAVSREDLKPKVEKLTKAESAEAESKIIAENKKKPEAQKAHDFKAAQWTHPNGHPRCLVCGDEERTGGKCEGLGAMKKAEAIREYNKQVDAAMETWDKVEHFRKFLAEKAPSLSKKEIEAFTRAFTMYRIKKAEKKLKDI